MTNRKYTVVTGASSGIGYETAKAFAERDKNLILIARRENKLNQLKKEIFSLNSNVNVLIFPTDLSIRENVNQLFNDLEPYELETWINNAGFGMYGDLENNNIEKVEKIVQLNVETLTLLSTLFVKKYRHVAGTQLINMSSAGGYTIVPNAVVYCATKFYVSAFTEGLAQELIQSKSEMRAKVLAPAATKTEFGQVANNLDTYDYDQSFGMYHTSQQMAQFLLSLYDSDLSVGHVNRETFTFELSDTLLPYAGQSKRNQKQVLDSTGDNE
ncbi:SDR family NAD(P)-dependent oxidoreductase [Enterococcus rivorum]|uniref:Oxidoreductase n=1 Tax=Enterococcus rivorum TaxID=762845 RepID=A0A1E5KT35_9ENTE|nr:SDR family NAD(P)-dependent oxidoreductase [Enterococcus rivorum]MBP2098068.1 short-subunit dehydrogenase [Enterococcus rivorum]OEH81013.1 oxidoreductase [Enterococcus rivorum]